MRRYVQGLVVLSLCAVAFTASCRRNQPSLVDTNQPPDTQLWYAPPDSTEYQYIVHLYWRGLDVDGTTTRFIWTVKDTLATDDFRWNPAARLRDFQEGRITTRTDSLMSFTAYKDVAGVGVRKNRQAFYVAAIDDNGVIDPFPAAVEFVATIDRLPEMRFVTYVNGVARNYDSNLPVPRDTVGMFKPFQISYHGITENGSVLGYRFFPLSATIILPGANTWTEDLSDTLRSFPNAGVDALPAGVFRFAAKCIDNANAESQVDAGQFRRGVCQTVVNFDPDTRINKVTNTFFRAGIDSTVEVNFTDGVPDTVPLNSWITFEFNGWEQLRVPGQPASGTRDSTLYTQNFPADRDMDFQVKYIRNSARVSGAFEDSGWLPRNGTHDSDPNKAADSVSVNIGSLEYEWYVRAIDENGAGDGTPPFFRIVGNYDPTLDSAALADHFGNPVNIATIDTLTWNFYKGIGWPYDEASDTLTVSGYRKSWGFTLSATGHDDPRDPPGSAVRAWQYRIYTNYNPATDTGTIWPSLGKSGTSWFPGTADNIMSDAVRLNVDYQLANGDDLIENPHGLFNKVVTIVLYGRDLGVNIGDFSQYVFLDEVPAGAVAGDGVSTKTLINSFSTGSLGRWTPRKVIQFYLKFER